MPMIQPPEATPVPWGAVAACEVFRVAFGLAMFMHGFARLVGGIDVSVHRYLAGFAHVPLPHDLVVLVIYAIPYIEVVIGAPVVLGLLTRRALHGNAALSPRVHFRDRDAAKLERSRNAAGAFRCWCRSCCWGWASTSCRSTISLPGEEGDSDSR